MRDVPASGWPLDAKDLVAAIELELVGLRAAGSRPGWTIWALLGASATCVWIGLQELDGPALPKTEILQVAGLSLFALSPTMRLLVMRRARSANSRYQGRVSHLMVPTYTAILSFCVRMVLFVSLVASPPTDTASGLCVMTAIVLLAAAVLDAGSLVAAQLRMPRPLTMQTARLAADGQEVGTHHKVLVWSSRVATGILWGIALMGVLVGSWWLLRLGAWVDVDNVRSFRFALVVGACYFLLRKLSIQYHYSTESPTVDSLVQIRRDLVLGRISPSTAVERMDLVFHGLTMVQFYATAVSKLVSNIDSFHRQLDDASHKLRTVDWLASKPECPDPEDDKRRRVALLPLLREIERHLVAAAPIMLDTVLPSRNSLRFKMLMIGTLAGDPKAHHALAPHDSMIDKSMDAFNELTASLYLHMLTFAGPSEARAMICRLNKSHRSLEFDPDTGRVRKTGG